jgi:hypothetical protein
MDCRDREFVRPFSDPVERPLPSPNSGLVIRDSFNEDHSQGVRDFYKFSSHKYSCPLSVRLERSHAIHGGRMRDLKAFVCIST